MNLQCLLIATIISATLGLPHRGRIFGGQPAEPGQFPSIVSINDPDQFCDGSIINKNWVVTAAHCIEVVTSTTTIIAGTNLVHSGGTTHRIVNWFKHEDYSSNTLRNDIGLIQIEDEFEFDDLTQPTEFIDPKADSTCYVAGWGVTDTIDFPEELQYIQQTILDLQTCRSYGGFNIWEAQACALAEEGRGACFGDSGGPLVCDGKLAGVASFIIDDCGAGNPDFYTKPSSYVEWINENTGSK